MKSVLQVWGELQTESAAAARGPARLGQGRGDGGGGGRPEDGEGASLCLHPFQLPMLDTLTLGIWPGPASEAGGRVGWGLRPSRRRGSWGALVFGSRLSSRGWLSHAEAPSRLACAPGRVAVSTP